MTSNGSRDVFVVKLDAAGEFVWARSMGGAGSEEGLGVAVDGDGNTYTTGYFGGTADFDPGVGVAELTGNGGRDVFVVKLDAAGEFVWAGSMGGPTADTGYGIAVDDDGNTYTTGSSLGGREDEPADFDPGDGVFDLPNNGGQGVFVVKLDAAGEFVWARNMGGSSTWIDEGLGVAVDGDGNTYTTGSFQGTADFDPGDGVFHLMSNGGRDVFVVKLDASGDFVWARSMGGTFDAPPFFADAGYGVVVDGAGNAYATGNFRGIADFDPGAGVTNLTSNGGTIDVFVVKLDSSGPTLRVPATTVAENSTAVGDVDAIDDVDSEGSGLVYSINAGADQALFSIDPNSGELAFLAAPDFEAPGDANGDNRYKIELAVTDSDGLSHAVYVTVTVTDVAENTGPIAVDDVYNDLPVNVRLDAGTGAAGIDVDDADGVLTKGTDDSDPEGTPLVVTEVNGGPIVSGVAITLPSGAEF